MEVFRTVSDRKKTKKQNKTKQNKPIKQQNRKVNKVIIIYLLIGTPFKTNPSLSDSLFYFFFSPGNLNKNSPRLENISTQFAKVYD